MFYKNKLGFFSIKTEIFTVSYLCIKNTKLWFPNWYFRNHHTHFPCFRNILSGNRDSYEYPFKVKQTKTSCYTNKLYTFSHVLKCSDFTFCQQQKFYQNTKKTLKAKWTHKVTWLLTSKIIHSIMCVCVCVVSYVTDQIFIIHFFW